MPVVKVHEFTMGDVDDPDLYVAEPILRWQQTEVGKWVMAHSSDTVFQRVIDHQIWGYRYKILANLSESDVTFFTLKWR